MTDRPRLDSPSPNRMRMSPLGTESGPPRTETRPPVEVVLPGKGPVKIPWEIASDHTKLQNHLRDQLEVPSSKVLNLAGKIHGEVTKTGFDSGKPVDVSGGIKPSSVGSETSFKVSSDPPPSKPQSSSSTLGAMSSMSSEDKGQRVSSGKKPLASSLMGSKLKKKEVVSEGDTSPKPSTSTSPKPSTSTSPKLTGVEPTSSQSGPQLSEFRLHLPDGRTSDIPLALAGNFSKLKQHLDSLGLESQESISLASKLGRDHREKKLIGGTSYNEPKTQKQEEVTVTMPWGGEMNFPKNIAQDPGLLGAYLMEPAQKRLMQGTIKPTELASKISGAIQMGNPLNFSEVRSTDNFLETGKLKVHSGEVHNPEPPDRTSVVTSEIRGGSKSSEVFKAHSLPTPVYGGGWSKDLGDIVPKSTPGSIQMTAVGMGVSKECNNGGLKPYVVEWPNKQGCTLLVDVSHDAKQFKPDNREHINLEFKVGGKPLKLTPDGGNVVRIESPGRAHLAIQIPKSELEKQFSGLADGHDISVQPFYCDKDRKDFHINEPHLVSMPAMFGRQVEGKRFEWPMDKVPVNTKTDIVGVSSPFLDPKAKLQTSMETEAEFTFKVDSPQQGEKLITDSVVKFEKLALPKKTVLTPEEQEAYNKRLQTELGLPPSMFDGKSAWKIERKNDDYYYLDNKGDLSPEANKIIKEKKEVGVALIEQFKNDVAPLRPELQSLGMGRPGIVKDTYLHVAEDGIVRQRGNFREDGTMSTKGANRRDGDDSPFMVRYCRQVPCTQEAPIKDGVVGKPKDLTELLYHDDIGFQDALFKYPKDGDMNKVNVSTPTLKPEMEVQSERYRYVLVHTALDESKKPVGQDVMIELSFDISKGQMLGPDGKPKGGSTTSYGFEFGLDHLGTSSDTTHDSGGSGKPGVSPVVAASSDGSNRRVSLPTSQPSSSTDVSSPVLGGPKTPIPTEKVEVDGPTIPRERHDRLDLKRDDLFTRPAYQVFTKCVKDFLPSIVGDQQIRIAGEKASTMKAELETGTLPTGYKTPNEIFKG